jgi:anti-anti-sigma factor
MAEPKFKHLRCPVVVVRVGAVQVMGDTLADELRDEFLAVYNGAGALDVVVDMQVVRYLSSAGLRPLLNLVRQVRERGGRLVLCNLNEEVRGVFEATRLITTHGATPATFRVETDVPSAVASLYQLPGST